MFQSYLDQMKDLRLKQPSTTGVRLLRPKPRPIQRVEKTATSHLEYSGVDPARQAYVFERSLHGPPTLPTSQHPTSSSPALADNAEASSFPNVFARPPSPELSPPLSPHSFSLALQMSPPSEAQLSLPVPEPARYNTRRAAAALQGRGTTSGNVHGSSTTAADSAVDQNAYDDEYSGSEDDYGELESRKREQQEARRERHRRHEPDTEEEDEADDLELEQDVVEDESVPGYKRKRGVASQKAHKRRDKGKGRASATSPTTEELAGEETPMDEGLADEGTRMSPFVYLLQLASTLCLALGPDRLRDTFGKYEDTQPDGTNPLPTVVEQLLVQIGMLFSQILHTIATIFGKDFYEVARTAGWALKEESRGPNAFCHFKRWYCSEHAMPDTSKPSS